MPCLSSIFNILLVDDEVQELDIIKRILNALTEAPISVDHVSKCSEAVRRLNEYHYDLVLLDNRLSETISAEFSAPFIRAAFSKARIAVISNNVDEPYLETPDQLGVSYVVDKSHMISFLRGQIEQCIEMTLVPEKRFARR